MGDIRSGSGADGTSNCANSPSANHLLRAFTDWCGYDGIRHGGFG
jgi:hypothetical protein